MNPAQREVRYRMRNPHSRAKTGLTGTVELVDNTKSARQRCERSGPGTGLEVQMPEERTADSVWRVRAVEALELALCELRGDEDPLPSMSLAEECLRAEDGALNADELEMLTEHFNPPEPVCICPPDLLARGGFRGGCPAHG
jgi:hypothetical protein